MEEHDQWGIVCLLVNEMREQGSWGGETHLQKGTYLLKHLVGVPLEYKFTLYKHGPFSFQLRDDLDYLRSGRALAYEPQERYGPKLRVERAIESEEAGKYRDQIKFVAEALGSKNVTELEALSTALLVTLERDDADAETRTKRLLELKPHLERERALKAVTEIDQLRRRVETEFALT